MEAGILNVFLNFIIRLWWKSKDFISQFLTYFIDGEYLFLINRPLDDEIKLFDLKLPVEYYCLTGGELNQRLSCPIFNDIAREYPPIKDKVNYDLDFFFLKSTNTIVALCIGNRKQFWAGNLRLHLNRNSVWLDFSYVQSRSRGKGFQAAIQSFAYLYYKKQSFSNCYFTISVFNRKSYKGSKKSGFEILGRLLSLRLFRKIDLVMYRKELFESLQR